MLNIKGAALVVAVIFASAASASAQDRCVNKAGEGQGTSRDPAMFAAYLQVLQSTNFAMSTGWAASNKKIGEAPGYTVTKLTSRCVAGGAGQICRIQATLCKN